MWHCWSRSVFLHHAWPTGLPLISKCVCCVPAVDASQCCCQSIDTLTQPSHLFFYYNNSVTGFVCICVLCRENSQRMGWWNEILWICAECISMFAGLYSRRRRTNMATVQECCGFLRVRDRPASMYFFNVCSELWADVSGSDVVHLCSWKNWSLIGWNSRKYY